MAADSPEKYIKFIEEFNRPLKEGLYSDHANEEMLLDLIRVKTTTADSWTSFAEVKARMKEGQKAIYFITGQNATQLRTSPLLEIYKKKDIEVVILADEIDEFVFSRIEKYQDVELKSVNKASAGDDLKDETTEEKREALTPLLEKLKGVLGDKVKDVRQSSRLADSPSCIVTDEEEPSMQMRQMLRAMGQKEMPDAKPILEINPDHDIVKKLLASTDDSLLEDTAFLLLDQALLVEGIALENPSAFVQRLNRVLNRAV